MSYLGRLQLGDTLDLVLQTTNGTAPTAPDNPPQVKIWSASALVTNQEMPLERPVQTGLFHHRVYLGADYATGYYTFVILYRVGSYYGVESGSFQVIPGGEQDGAVTSMYFFRRPQASFLVNERQTGKILKGKNPSI